MEYAKRMRDWQGKKYQEINHYLDTIRTKILQIHRELEQDGKPITADIIKISIMENTLLPKCCLKYSRNTIRNIGN